MGQELWQCFAFAVCEQDRQACECQRSWLGEILPISDVSGLGIVSFYLDVLAEDAYVDVSGLGIVPPEGLDVLHWAAAQSAPTR